MGAALGLRGPAVSEVRLCLVWPSTDSDCGADGETG